MNGLIVQWLKHTDTRNGEQIITLPISFSNTDFVCFKILQAWNSNSTVNNQIHSVPETKQSIKTFGYKGFISYCIAIGI